MGGPGWGVVFGFLYPDTARNQKATVALARELKSPKS